MTVTPPAAVFAAAAPARHLAEDARFMRLALALARRHLGRTWPNPSVGAVIVRNDGAGPVIVATGITQPGGRPHAERVALAAAGDLASRATLYVSLEPCSHHGRTPPCANSVVEAGIARVVSAVEDPDVRVTGRGHARLREARLDMTVGVLAEAAAQLNRGHFVRVRQGRPFVTLKLARTADGMAGVRSGERLLITGEAADARVHLMRAKADAVLVGIGTVLADDPLLTVRLPGMERRSPVRVVFDTDLRIPPASRLVQTACEHEAWIVCADDAPRECEESLTALGLKVIRVPKAIEGHLDLHAAMRVLAERGLTRVLCEGGPHLADRLAAADLIDEVALLTGPAAFGQPGVPAIEPALADSLVQLFESCEDEQLGTDHLQILQRRGG